MTVLTLLESADRSATFFSRVWWETVVRWLGGDVRLEGPAALLGTVPFWPVAGVVAAAMAAGGLTSAVLARGLAGVPWRAGIVAAASSTGRCGCWIGLWFALWLVTSALDFERAAGFVEVIADLWCAVAVAAWGTAAIARCQFATPAPPLADLEATSGRGLRYVLAGVGLYTVVYTAMNWQMYHALLIPHGDSVMYEEHLWNLLHGKGFRSYLDQGLFLGEHMQVLHLALIPLYVLWPSHLLLELCESLALGITALPVYWIARRHTGSDVAGVWMAAATLLYFPLHYLDIAIDFKTFRPMALSVPILMFAIDQLERGRLKTMALLLFVSLTGKEDLAIVIAPLGVWLCVTAWWCQPAGCRPWECAGVTRKMAYGAAMAVLATLYLMLAVKVFIPWFRGGETVHYARYFSRFGETPTEIVTTMLTRPGLLAEELITAGTIVYALRVLIPLGGMPLLSPGRLLVGAPLFVLLCLNEIAQDTPAPVHHFHAPLVPIVLWAAAAGLPASVRLARRPSRGLKSVDPERPLRTLRSATFACLCALLTSAVISFHPLSLKFWDAGRATYWRRLFVPGERAAQFAKIEALIPPDSRVASTDFVHPRYTHHERSYDYSDYLRKVAGYEHRVPDDTDYIVIDTQHPYSTIKRPEDVRELRLEPEKWELLNDVWEQTDGYFLVLRRSRR